MAENTPPVVSDGERNLANMLDRWATDPTIEPEKIQIIWNIRKEYMQELHREREYQARIAYNDVIAKASSELTQIDRTKLNGFLSYKYATLAQIDKTLRPVLEKHDIGLRFVTEDKPDRVTVVAVVSHHGHEERIPWSAPPDMSGSRGGASKTPIQAQGSTATYLRKYLTNLVFNLVPADDPTDDDGESTRGRPFMPKRDRPDSGKQPNPPDNRFEPV
jgi:hypothetical protein